jgi:hypothetical protein
MSVHCPVTSVIGLFMIDLAQNVVSVLGIRSAAWLLIFDRRPAGGQCKDA